MAYIAMIPVYRDRKIRQEFGQNLCHDNEDCSPGWFGVKMDP